MAVVLGGKEHLGKEETESWGADTWPRSTESRGGPELRMDDFSPIDRFDTELQTGSQLNPGRSVSMWTEAHWTSVCNSVLIQAKLSIWERKEDHLPCLTQTWHAMPLPVRAEAGVSLRGHGCPGVKSASAFRKRSQVWAAGCGKWMVKHY